MPIIVRKSSVFSHLLGSKKPPAQIAFRDTSPFFNPPFFAELIHQYSKKTSTKLVCSVALHFLTRHFALIGYKIHSASAWTSPKFQSLTLISHLEPLHSYDGKNVSQKRSATAPSPLPFSSVSQPTYKWFWNVWI